MTSTHLQLQVGRLVVSMGLVLVAIATSATEAVAQDNLFSNVDTFANSSTRHAPAQVALSGDTAVLGEDGLARVFGRAPGQDLWSATATLSASDATSGFGVSVATDGTSIVVGAAGAAFVFQQGPSGWQEVAKLTGSVNAATFGTTVGVDGATIIVGAPNQGYDGAVIRGAQGRVYVFEGNGSQVWTEVAMVNGQPIPDFMPLGVDSFGYSIAIDQDTFVVSAHSPRTMADTAAPVGYVFERNQGGADAWGLVKRVQLFPETEFFFDAIQPFVAISGDTIAMGSSRPAIARIFERNQGGPDAWGLAATLLPDDPRAGLTANLMVTHVSLSGDRVFVASNFIGGRPRLAYVFSRHDGGHNVWGEVARFAAGTTGIASGAIDGDTLIAGNTYVTNPLSPIDVYVADTDRDGIRDGIDPCPNDPLNNTAGSCARDSGGTPVLDEYVTADSVEVVSYGNPFVIRATFTNTTEAAMSNPFFEVTYLSAGNELLNADAGPSGTGATLTADVGDGVLSPGESMTVVFEIGLNSSDPFGFLVSLHGTTD